MDDPLEDLNLKYWTKLIKGIFPKDHESDEVKNEPHEIKKDEHEVIRDNLFYESNKQASDFKVFEKIKSLGDTIYNHKIGIHEANQKQADLLEHILSFNNKTKPRSHEDKYKKWPFW